MIENDPTLREAGTQILRVLAAVNLDPPPIEDVTSAMTCDWLIRDLSLVRNLADLTIRVIEKRRDFLQPTDEEAAAEAVDPGLTVELAEGEGGAFRPFPDIPPMSLWLFGLTEKAFYPASTDREEMQQRQVYLSFREGISELLGIQPKQDTVSKSEAGRVAGTLIRGDRLPTELFERIPGKGVTFRGVVWDLPQVRDAAWRMQHTIDTSHVLSLFALVAAGEAAPEEWVELFEQRKDTGLAAAARAAAQKS